MYSTQVIEKAIERYESSAKHRLARIDPPRVESWIAHLDSRLKTAGDEDTFWKSTTREEKLFIRNERVMSMLDFRYAAERYFVMQQDGGGVTKFSHPWESQEIILRRIATLEQQMFDAALRGEPVEGILIALNKARQLGATAIARLIIVHRLITQHHRRGMAASVDEDKIQELYDRDKLILDSVPWWLKPSTGYDEKRSHVYFDKLDSRIIYQVSSQKSGLGVGRQFDLAHLTELSTWLNAASIELDFFPTLPQSSSTFALLESTPYGRGTWWHDFTERVRQGASARWNYIFIPYYVEKAKHSRHAPDTWVPSEIALKHASHVYETSAEFMGAPYLIPRDTLYWWETTRADYMKGNNLSFFLTNYASTPEESFQHSGQSAFSPELLSDLRTGAHTGVAYELRG